jgi:hypothetical protein
MRRSFYKTSGAAARILASASFPGSTASSLADPEVEDDAPIFSKWYGLAGLVKRVGLVGCQVGSGQVSFLFYFFLLCFLFFYSIFCFEFQI